MVTIQAFMHRLSSPLMQQALLGNTRHGKLSEICTKVQETYRIS